MWMPNAGRQTEAYLNEADIVGYGGAAGGGKTDLAVGLAITNHHRSIIYRRETQQLIGVIQRMEEIMGTRDGFNSQTKVWRVPHSGRLNFVEFGGCPNLGNEKRYQGRPHDLKVFDEVTEFLEAQVRFLLGWLRHENPLQRTRVLMTFNPPTTTDGQWVLKYFAPWLDPDHPNPAKPGEIRWFTTVNGADKEMPSGDPVTLDNGEVVYPMSRTFIPAKVQDNPFYMNDNNYISRLQAMPEPLRSQMLKGDFMAGVTDDPWQIIPSAWVEAAMKRWKPRTNRDRGPMSSMGVDVARGGRDKNYLSRRHGHWYDELAALPGATEPDGPGVAGWVISQRQDRAPVHIDMVGWGASPYDFLVANQIQVIGINGASGSVGQTNDESRLQFINLRAELWWRMREALDPKRGYDIELPPDSELKADLCAPKWELTPKGIKVEEKKEIIKRIGRSPDKGDAVCLANIETMKEADLPWNEDVIETDYDHYES